MLSTRKLMRNKGPRTAKRFRGYPFWKKAAVLLPLIGLLSPFAFMNKSYAKKSGWNIGITEFLGFGTKPTIPEIFDFSKEFRAGIRLDGNWMLTKNIILGASLDIPIHNAEFGYDFFALFRSREVYGRITSSRDMNTRLTLVNAIAEFGLYLSPHETEEYSGGVSYFMYGGYALSHSRLNDAMVGMGFALDRYFNDGSLVRVALRGHFYLRSGLTEGVIDFTGKYLYLFLFFRLSVADGAPSGCFLLGEGDRILQQGPSCDPLLEDPNPDYTHLVHTSDDINFRLMVGVGVSY